MYNVLGKSVEFSTQAFYPGPIIKKPPEEQQASLKSIDASNITSVPTSVYMPKWGIWNYVPIEVMNKTFDIQFKILIN